MKKDWIKEAYRSWFSRLDEDVPEEVWTEIADELDLDEVWNNLSEELDRTPRLSPWRWLPRAAAVLALLVSALAAYWYLFPPQRKGETPLATQSLPSAALPPENGPGGNASSGDAPAGNESPANGGLSAAKAPQNGSPADNELASGGAQGDAYREKAAPGNRISADHGEDELPERGSLAVSPVEQNGLRLSPEQERWTAVPLLPSLPGGIPGAAGADSTRITATEIDGLKVPGELMAGIRPPDQPAAGSGKQSPFIQLQRLGVVSAYNNTWMLNHETFNGLQASTLNATTITYSTSTGLNAGFLLKGKHKVNAELYLSSSTGQDYRQYIEARYQSRSIELDYYKLQLYYQLPVFSGKGDVLLGAYTSYLKRGREKVAGEARGVGRFYRDIDYGIMTGYQFNLPVNNRLLLQPGIRLNYGLPNIFKGNQLIPGNFLRTHNAAAGLYLGVSYRLY
ncbi:hypothetical protein [Anseongella ginsenosidimutans]|uniref:hypothetical protein n=1 Tax=Anseongella ginsenosidimutans TaxID=496056 RepID=UPI00104B4146|nr:hypothetical protein [Anseongella ginsenosidimutans]QEC51457.1 hypothetical protein FRZ59_03210 [Anseongella ginsenosidimutans]